MSTEGATARKRRATQARPSVEVRTFPGYEYGGKKYEQIQLVQRPMSFFDKTELFGLVASGIDSMVNDGYLDVPTLIRELDLSDDQVDKLRQGQVDFTMLPAAPALLNILARIVRAAPDLMQNAYLLFLGVPPEDRSRVLPYLRQMDDDTGMKILETAIEQNEEAFRDFWPRWQALLGRVQERRSSTKESSGD